jgi:outer membrane protein OmpA-like peptidoglycan-associated protein/DNA-binding transcriptional MerR regulator
MNSNNNRHASLDEVAGEYNLARDALISFQDMGLIRPVELENQQPLLGPFSRLRIKYILYARSQGLSFAEIVSLIGKIPLFADESTQILKSLEVSQEKVAQLRRQIEISEPLEKVNRSCDLILLQNYITSLKAMLAREKEKVPTPAVFTPHPVKPNAIETTKMAPFPGTRSGAPPLIDDDPDEEIAPANGKSVWRRWPLALSLIALLCVPFLFNTLEFKLLLEKGKQWRPSFLTRPGYGSSTSLPLQPAPSEIVETPSEGKKPDPETLPEEDLRKPEPALPGPELPTSSSGSESPSSDAIAPTTPDKGALENVTSRGVRLGEIQRRIPVPTQKFIIQCEHDSAAISEPDKMTLDLIAEFVALYPATRLIIRGYTDNQGDPGYNLTLSASRARQGKTLMVSKGIDPLNIETVGMGSADPVASNQTPEGRKMNRRIEIELVPEAMQ